MRCAFCALCTQKTTRVRDREYEDARVIVVRSTSGDGVRLVIPKRHIAGVEALGRSDVGLLKHMVRVAHRVVGAPLEGGVVTGFHLAPFRSVHHLHMHVVIADKLPWFKRLAYVDNGLWFSGAQRVIRALSLGRRVRIEKF